MRFAVAKKSGFIRAYGLDITRQLSDFFSVDVPVYNGQNLGQWTSEQYTNDWLKKRYVQVVSNFNASSSTLAINPGSKFWVALDDVNLLNSSEIQAQNNPKPTPSGSSIFDWVKPTTSPQTTTTQSSGTWQLSTWYSIGTPQNVARIRANPGGAIMVDNIKYGSPVIVEARREYWKGEWIPARVKEGVWGYIHQSVVSAVKPIINSQTGAESGLFDYAQPKPKQEYTTPKPNADLPLQNTPKKQGGSDGIVIVAVVAMVWDMLKKAKIL